MGTIHKAFMGELAKVPRLILLKLITEKLAEQGLGDHTGLADALTDHCLKGDGDTFIGTTAHRQMIPHATSQSRFRRRMF